MLGASPKNICSACRHGMRPVMGVLMIASLALAHVGYPVWEPATSTSGEAFPCQFGRCGCRTLEQCRTSCCCHSKQEKIAWAMERGIDPDRVAVLTAGEKLQYSLRSRSVKSVNLCSTKASAKSCCCSKSAKPACCSEGEQPGRLTIVLAINAQKCTGTGVEWIQAGFVAAPPMPVLLVISIPQVPLSESVVPFYQSPTSGHLLRPA